jgi:hypothetical protein
LPLAVRCCGLAQLLIEGIRLLIGKKIDEKFNREPIR